MNWPPMLMHIKIHGKKGKFGFWLPLFLLIPLALVILIILSPLIIIALIVLWMIGLWEPGFGRWGWWALRCLGVAIVSFWSMRGLKVDVQGPNETVFISIV